MNNIKIHVRVTALLLTDWMDLDTLVAAQLREIARVLGPQGAPAEPDIGSLQASFQGILSNFRRF